MGIFDRFKKDKNQGPDPITGLSLSRIKPGYLFDYDLKTWEVTGYNVYDWGDGDTSQEWQIKNESETWYLERERDDEDDWSLNRKISFGRLGAHVKAHILEHEDPPDEIVFEGTTYYLEETSGGHFLKNGQGLGQPLLRWSYEDDEGETYLGIEQWGEEEFEASIGRRVEEYQFTNILPGAGDQSV
jgi:hypothetical protein